MADRYPIAPQVVDPVVDHINHTIDRLIGLLNVRRVQLLELVCDAREDKRAAVITLQQTIAQLTEAQSHLEGHLSLNPLQSMQERLVGEIERELNQLRISTKTETQFKFHCDTSSLEMSISELGRIDQVPIGSPNYNTFRSSRIVAGRRGTAPGELSYPHGIAVHETTHQIFVANSGNNRVEVFSEAGDYLHQLGLGHLYTPYGVAIHGDSLYVSCLLESTLCQFSLEARRLVRRVGSRGSDVGQFDHPRQVATDPIGRVFIADSGNGRICVHNTDLNYLRSIAHVSISKPIDVKVSHDKIYALSPHDNPCMHVLTLTGELLHSLISCGEGMGVLYPLFFCLDPLDQFVVCDEWTHSIRVFSQKGDLLHTIGREGHLQGMFSKPQGVAISPNGRLVCVSNNANCGLQIFF